MKKLVILATAFAIAGCSSTFTANDPVESGKTIDTICIKEAKRPRFRPFVPALVKSLEAKGFRTAVHIEVIPLSCKYLLSYSVRNDGALIEQANVRFHERESDSSFDSIGNIGYKNRNKEENEFAQKAGVQGQADRIIAELFKNY